MSEHEEIISGRDAAKLLRVSYSHLYALIDRGLLTRLDEPDELRAHTPLRFPRKQVEELRDRIRKKSSDDAA